MINQLSLQRSSIGYYRNQLFHPPPPPPPKSNSHTYPLTAPPVSPPPPPASLPPVSSLSQPTSSADATCRLYNMVEEQLKWFAAQFPDTVLPRDLLRTHLTEVISPDMLDEQSSYLGNRLAACFAKQHSLFFSCCGSAGHKLALTVLRTDADACQVSRLLLDCLHPPPPPAFAPQSLLVSLH